MIIGVTVFLANGASDIFTMKSDVVPVDGDVIVWEGRRFRVAKQRTLTLKPIDEWEQHQVKRIDISAREI